MKPFEDHASANWIGSHSLCLSDTFSQTGKPKPKTDDKNEAEEEDLADTEAANKADSKAEEQEANPQEEVEETIEGVGKMKVGGVAQQAASSDPFCMNFRFPHIMHDCEAKDRKVIAIDFLVVGVHKKNLRPKVSDDGGEPHLGCAVPSFFAEDRRLELADATVRHDTHKMTAFRGMRQSIPAKHGDGSEEEPLIGEPQKVQLPFAVEHEIRKWEVQTFENDDEDFHQCMQEVPQHFFVLTATMLSVEKRCKKKEGNFRIFGSPRPDCMEEDDESGDEH